MSLNTLSNIQLVTIALGNLDGHETPVDSEDVAVHVNVLAPGKFSWRKYPEYIDLQVVNQSLQDARRKRNGSLVTGSSSKGWMLSAAGMEWFKNFGFESTSDIRDAVQYRRGSIMRSQDLERRRLKDTRAYILYCESKLTEVTRNDFFEFAKINEYFPLKARARRYEFIESAVAGHKGLYELWIFLRTSFAKEFE
jgi:hypothetical protein